MRLRPTRYLTALGASAFQAPASTQQHAFSAFAAEPASAPTAAPAAPAYAVASAQPQQLVPLVLSTPLINQASTPQNAATPQAVSFEQADPGSYAYEAPPDDSNSAGDGWGLESWLRNLKPIGWLEIALLAFGAVYIAKKI